MVSMPVLQFDPGPSTTADPPPLLNSPITHEAQVAEAPDSMRKDADPELPRSIAPEHVSEESAPLIRTVPLEELLTPTKRKPPIVISAPLVTLRNPCPEEPTRSDPVVV